MATLEPLPVGADPFAGATDPRLEPLPAGADPFTRALPGATPEDEASPIATEDIVEGRRIIADAEARKRANGAPFRTRQSADLSARTRRMKAEPVETDGGWGLRPKP